MIKQKSLYKTEAIVIKTFDLFEADKIITLVSRDFGLIKAVAKGIRRAKSRFGARLEPFSRIDLVLYKGKELDTITQVELIDPYSGIRASLDSVSYGSAMLELTEKVVMPGQSNPEAYRLLLSAIETLDKGRVDARLLLAAFHLKLAVVAGFEPHVSECVNCGIKLQPKQTLALSKPMGGSLCAACSTTHTDLIYLKQECAVLLTKFARIKRDELESIKLSRELIDEIFAVSLDYLRYHLDVRLRSYDYLMVYERGQKKPQRGGITDDRRTI